MRNTIIRVGYTLAAVALVLFSYTQVDLNLTLSRVGIVQTVEKLFQHVGYYERPLATSLYILLIVCMFFLYAAALYGARKGTLTVTSVWRLIFLVTAIGVVSYPAAFSYDFFNYLFTAKTVLVYHANPYIVEPLQYAGIDPWTNFMRWTHLPSAYPPLWIGFTLLPYLLGLGYFVPVLFAVKAMVAGFYLLTAWAIGKIVKATKPQLESAALVFFALSPLIIIESLVSSHNDVVLTGFAMIALWLLWSKKPYGAWLFLALSVASKFMTIFLIPGFVARLGKRYMLAFMLAGLGLVLLRREFLPWYWVWIIPFVSIMPEYPLLWLMTSGVSVGLLLRYAPFFYFGTYDMPVPQWELALTVIPIAVTVLFVMWQYLRIRPKARS
jgi:hypothetical protein